MQHTSAVHFVLFLTLESAYPVTTRLARRAKHEIHFFCLHPLAKQRGRTTAPKSVRAAPATSLTLSVIVLGVSECSQSRQAFRFRTRVGESYSFSLCDLWHIAALLSRRCFTLIRSGKGLAATNPNHGGPP